MHVKVNNCYEELQTWQGVLKWLALNSSAIRPNDLSEYSTFDSSKPNEGIGFLHSLILAIIQK